MLLTIIEVGGLVAVAIAGFLATPAARVAGRVLVGAAAGDVRPRDGVRAVHLRRLERGRVHLRRAQGRAARDRSGAADQPRDPRGDLRRREHRACCTASGSRDSPTARPPAPTSCSAAFGSGGAALLSLVVAIAALTSINATMIVGARTNYAMGRDWPALRFMGGWHAAARDAAHGADRAGGRSRSRWSRSARSRRTASRRWSSSPRRCSGRSCCWSASRCSCCARRMPAIERPFRVPLYPITPVVFCAACAWLAYSSITYAASRSAVHISLIVMAVGVVALLITRMKRHRRRTSRRERLAKPRQRAGRLGG